jgi:hypothetical protein
VPPIDGFGLDWIMSSRSAGSPTSSMGSTRLGVSHLIEEGYRYPNRVELARGFLSTPVHPNLDILWSDRRKWLCCLWSTALGTFLLIVRAAGRRNTLESKLQLMYDLVFYFAVLAIIILFLVFASRLYSPAKIIVSKLKRKFRRKKKKKPNYERLAYLQHKYLPSPPEGKPPTSTSLQPNQRNRFGTTDLAQKHEDFAGLTLEYKDDEGSELELV